MYSSRMRDAECLAHAVLLYFRSSGPWTSEDDKEWYNLTRTREATSRNLCELARHVKVMEGKRNG